MEEDARGSERDAQTSGSRLDFFSPDFDALAALNTPSLQPPAPQVKALDNVSKCRAILPAEVPESLLHMSVKQSTEEAKLKAASFKERATRMQQRVEESISYSLEKVHSYVKPGPLQQLKVWYDARARVRVVTRHARGVRGVAEGKLIGYDRYMNVLLKDVHENYSVLLRVTKEKEAVVTRPAKAHSDQQPVEEGEVGEIEATVRKTRLVRRQEKRTRQLPQLFVKGDSIVLVSCLRTETADNTKDQAV